MPSMVLAKPTPPDNITLEVGPDGKLRIKDLGVSTAKLADSAVTSAKIAAGAVGSLQIASGAVGTGHIADGAVTDVKIDTMFFAKIRKHFGDGATFLIIDRSLLIDGPGGGADPGGSATIDPSVAGIVKLTTPATAGGRAWWNFGVGVGPGGSFARARVTCWAVSFWNRGNARTYMGWMSALPSAAEPPTEPADGVYVRVVNGATLVAPQSVCRSAGTETAVAWAGNPDWYPRDWGFSHEYVPGLVARFLDGGGNIINTITTNVPRYPGSFHVVQQTREAVAKDIGGAGHVLFQAFGG